MGWGARLAHSLLILICTAVGYVFGCGGAYQAAVLVHALAGTALPASGTSALNQWYEGGVPDAKMRRTRLRPIPAGRLTRNRALLFGLILSGAGFGELWYGTNLLTAALGLFTRLTYLLIYTPLKQRSPIYNRRQRYRARCPHLSATPLQGEGSAPRPWRCS